MALRPRLLFPPSFIFSAPSAKRVTQLGGRMLRARDPHPALDEMDRKPADATQKWASFGLTPFVPAE